MEYWIYYKNDEELMTFADWVNEHGSDEDKETHDGEANQEVQPSEKFTDLLNKYITTLGATHIRKFNDDTPVSELEELDL